MSAEASDDPRARPRRRSLAEDALNLPNLLTFGAHRWSSRSSSAPRPDHAGARLLGALVFTLAAITDMLDGYLARKLGVVSVLGKFLDPLADKLIVMAALVWMVPMGRIPAWVVVVLLGREISVTGLRSVAASEGVVICAGKEGKTKTALQMIGIIALLLGYPYHLSYAGLDLGVVDLVHVGARSCYCRSSSRSRARRSTCASSPPRSRPRTASARTARPTKDSRAGVPRAVFWQMSRPAPDALRASFSLVAAAAVAAVAARSSEPASHQSEGQRADRENGNIDCNNGPDVRVPAERRSATNAPTVCCPPDRTPATTAQCAEPSAAVDAATPRARRPAEARSTAQTATRRRGDGPTRTPRRRRRRLGERLARTAPADGSSDGRRRRPGRRLTCRAVLRRRSCSTRRQRCSSPSPSSLPILGRRRARRACSSRRSRRPPRSRTRPSRTCRACSPSSPALALLGPWMGHQIAAFAEQMFSAGRSAALTRRGRSGSSWSAMSESSLSSRRAARRGAPRKPRPAADGRQARAHPRRGGEGLRRKGFYATRVSEVAKAAGVADGTIYLYFKSKDELLVSLFEDRVERLLAFMHEELPQARERAGQAAAGHRDAARPARGRARSRRGHHGHPAPVDEADEGVRGAALHRRTSTRSRAIVAEGQAHGRSSRRRLAAPRRARALRRARRHRAHLGARPRRPRRRSCARRGSSRSSAPRASRRSATTLAPMKRLAERARIARDVRAFFDARGFLEVETPIAGALAGARPAPRRVRGRRRRRGAPRWLGTSPEYQMKRLLADGLRAHLPDRARLPPRRARRAAQPRVHDARVVPRARGRRRRDARHRAARRARHRRRRCASTGARCDVRPPFARITVCDAFARWRGWSRPRRRFALAAEDEDRYFRAARRPRRAGARRARSRGVPHRVPGDAGVARAEKAGRSARRRALRALRRRRRAVQRLRRARRSDRAARALRADQRRAARARTARLPDRREAPRGAARGCRRAAATRSASIASSRSRAARRRSRDVIAFTADEV